MRELRGDIQRWIDEGRTIALAQVIRTWGSSLRATGSLMAINDNLCISGSVSGGCIEGDVVQEAYACFEAGQGSLQHYHASMQRAHDVGLSCGGDIDILLSPLLPDLFALECKAITEEREYIRVSIADAPDPALIGTYFLMISNEDEAIVSQGCKEEQQSGFSIATSCCTMQQISRPLLQRAAHMVEDASRSAYTGRVTVEGIQFFFNRELPQPLLICVGGVHISIHLTQLAKILGYRTVVIDPRGIFTSEDRFAFVDELLHEWPQEALKKIPLHASSALCALTHDPKIDIPALAAALNSPAFYIGSLGRHTTQLTRYTELRGLGFSDEKIARVSGPIGIDVGGRGPQEIALSIMAEINMVRYGKTFAMTTMLDSAQRARAEELIIR